MSEKVIIESLKKLFEVANSHWPFRTGLLSALAIVFITLAFLFSAIDFSKVPLFGWIFICFMLLITVCFWWKTRLPRVPKNKVGIGLALSIEDDAGSKVALTDFQYKLRELLQGSKLRHEFEFVEIPQSIAETIKNAEIAQSIAQKANLSFLLFGRIFTRASAGNTAHHIDLHGYIRHVPIDEALSIRFGQEFRSALPVRYKFSSDHGLPACEFAAQHVDAATKYMIGIAASFCGDFIYAEELFLNAETLLKQYIQQSQASPLLSLLEKVQFRIKELYKQWIAYECQSYTMHRNIDALTRCEPLIQKLNQRDGGDPFTHGAAAVCAFVLHQDISKTKQEIDACKGRKNAVYWYNKAFIDAFEGNLDECYKSYSKAFNEPLLDPTIPNQCEEFIQIALENNPDKPWLYFCLGLINYRAKEDLISARRDFESFLTKVDTEKYPRQSKVAKEWLNEMTKSNSLVL